MKRSVHVLLPALLLMTLSSSLSIALQGQDRVLKPDDLVSRHLDALGPAAAREAAKTRVVQAPATYRILVGGGGRDHGTLGLVSEGHKLRLVLRFPGNYRGENVLFNGDVAQVAFSNSDQSRSPLASFLATQDVILRDGLLGGVLTTAWPLQNSKDRGAKLVYEGLKKVDGRPLHQFRYEPRKHSEVEIVLYFDAETLRHVKTVYSTSVANNVGATILESARLKPERSQLEERFSDFITVDGLTLPAHWNLQFTRELPDGSTTISEWDAKGVEIKNNVGLDPRNFAAK
jgi:hypothetical protein